MFAGTINQGAPLRLEATAVGESTLLAEIVRLMELAEQRRAKYVVLADRIARLYAPAVHGLALATFLGWTLFGGIAWQTALLYAVAVLIITCPCALGLAVPAVQVIASGRLLRKGVLLKSATALERLAEVDTVVLDKTGTLTLGHPTLDRGSDPAALELAASLAGASRHPLAGRSAGRRLPCRSRTASRKCPAKACAAARSASATVVGVESKLRTRWRDRSCGSLGLTGRRSVSRSATRCAPMPPRWSAACGSKASRSSFCPATGRRWSRRSRASSASRPGRPPARRPQSPPVSSASRATGRKVLMVGDGLNDAPALAGAYVSASPASAVDISQTAADAVFQGDRLQPLLELLLVAGRARALIRQNFAMALAYNLVTLPLAMAGLVTPLIAALCMSASSLVVVGNALRLGQSR